MAAQMECCRLLGENRLAAFLQVIYAPKGSGKGSSLLLSATFLPVFIAPHHDEVGELGRPDLVSTQSTLFMEIHLFSRVNKEGVIEKGASLLLPSSSLAKKWRPFEEEALLFLTNDSSWRPRPRPPIILFPFITTFSSKESSKRERRERFRDSQTGNGKRNFILLLLFLHIFPPHARLRSGLASLPGRGRRGADQRGGGEGQHGGEATKRGPKKKAWPDK